MAASTIAAQQRLPHTVGVNHDGGLGVTLRRATRHNFSRRLAGKFRRDAVRGQQTLGMSRRCGYCNGE
jgi:hypothetical protein